MAKNGTGSHHNHSNSLRHSCPYCPTVAHFNVIIRPILIETEINITSHWGVYLKTNAMIFVINTN